MLADTSSKAIQSGILGQEIQLPKASLYELLDFIGGELPRWRDRQDRRIETTETVLTSQLCAHLNSAARLSPGWDILQFRPEEPDETMRGRRIDLVAAPKAVTILIEGRAYSDFDALLPIECKRLPTPRGAGRELREYVFTENSTTGGIQRFKDALHGAGHSIGAMIGYIQEENCESWIARVSTWIREVVETIGGNWSADDSLLLVDVDVTARAVALKSTHRRVNGIANIELRHFWIEMN